MKICLIPILLLGFSVSQASELSYPKLFFNYSRLYDNVCSQAPGKTIDREWQIEARFRTKEFESMWLNEAPNLMSKLFELFNLGFQRKEMTATLSICPKSPTTSNPLVLNVTRYLKSYMKDQPVREDHQFVDLVFHELLHTWIVENLNWPSPLIVKYQNEPPVIQNHLHLLAIQKYVYSELKRDDLLNWLSESHTNPLMDANYRKA